MAEPFTTCTHTHTDFILKIHWLNPITHSNSITCTQPHCAFSHPNLSNPDTHTNTVFSLKSPCYWSSLSKWSFCWEMMGLNCVCVYICVWVCACVSGGRNSCACLSLWGGCMRRTKQERVNVILSMRLSLIDGQLKSWFPFTLLSAESLRLSFWIIASDK